MNEMQEAAYIMAQAACVNAIVAGMQIANDEKIRRGLPPPYKEDDFRQLINEYGIHHNAVLTTFRR